MSDMPNDERTPAQDAASATEIEVWKKITAMITVRSQPRMPMSVPDCFRKTSPMKIRIMGRMARRNWKARSTMNYPVSLS